MAASLLFGTGTEFKSSHLDAYTTSDIIYKWDETGITIDKTANGALPNFEISAYKNATCDSVTNTG